MNIVSDRDSFVWKGHDPLNVRPGPITMTPGFQVCLPLMYFDNSFLCGYKVHDFF